MPMLFELRLIGAPQRAKPLGYCPVLIFRLFTVPMIESHVLGAAGLSPWNWLDHKAFEMCMRDGHRPLEQWVPPDTFLQRGLGYLFVLLYVKTCIARTPNTAKYFASCYP